MTVLTEGRHPGEFLMSEGAFARSRAAITILSGEGVLKPGTVLGKVAGSTGTVTVAAAAASAGNTGNGTVTLATPAYGAGVQEGTYRIVFIEPATNLGTFIVEGPDGKIVGEGKVGTAFDNQLKFTIDDSTTDFVAGDSFTIAVSIADAAGAGKYRSADPTNTDGSGVARAVLLYGVDATSADVAVTAIVRDAVVNVNCLEWDAAVDDAAKKATKVAELAAVGIIAR